MKIPKFVYVGLRIFFGCFFLVSGFEKLIGPYQNFLYVVQNYEVLPTVLEEVTAHVVPWIELFLGIFLLLGLWTRFALIGYVVLFSTFITIVSQALIRDLPITECGCLGELISFPLYVVLIIDTVSLCGIVFLLKNINQTLTLSLDKYFS